jgi:hypothetical protein
MREIIIHIEATARYHFILFPKCSKTHRCATTTGKVFWMLYPQTPGRMKEGEEKEKEEWKKEAGG